MCSEEPYLVSREIMALDKDVYLYPNLGYIYRYSYDWEISIYIDLYCLGYLH